MEQLSRNASAYHERIPSQETLPASHPFATNIDPFADPRTQLPEGLPPTTLPPATNASARPFYKTRKFIICQVVSFSLGIIILFVLLFPVVKAIAQHTVNGSKINISSAKISNPSNTSFTLSMSGNVTHSGHIPATITFTKPVNVAWSDPNSPIPVPLGTLSLQPIRTNEHATGNLSTVPSIFSINATSDAFGNFTKFLITKPNFTWILTSDDLEVHALKLPVAKGIKFNQTITLGGINNFDNKVNLSSFALPGDASQGGITFSAVTSLDNASPFVIDLGTATFNLTYNDVFLGQGVSDNTVLTTGINNIILNGTLVPHNESQSDLDNLGTLFTNYINGIQSDVVATGVSTTQSDGSVISWLSEGLTALSLNVPFKPPTPINPIQSISIGSFNLSFSEETPFAPIASSDSVTAEMKLPFGFTVNISQIQNTFAINQNGSNVANLSTPIGASVSDIMVFSQTDTHGTIDITIKDTPLNIPASQQQAFSLFNEQLTDSSMTTFQLIGGARAVAELPIGTITLNPINFDVTSSLSGLQGLQGATVIKTVDVIGGTSSDILLNIGLSIHNPSNLNLNLGDLSLQLFNQGSLLGTTLLTNLSLLIGDNDGLTATGFFNPNSSPTGLQTLSNFVAGQDTSLGISGYSGSSNITSLLPAFESVHVNATLPGLNTTLLKSASLEVLSTTGHGNSIAHATVNLENPFTGGLTINSINSTIRSHGILLGTINTNTDFAAPGKKVSTSPNLDLEMNLDPSSVFTVLRALAIDSGMSTDQIDAIISLGGYQILPTTSADSVSNNMKRTTFDYELEFDESNITQKRANIFTGFNLPSFVDQAFKDLRTDISITTGVSIGDYVTTLNFAQEDVPVNTDSSLNLLLPILAQPIVQKVVEGSILDIDTVLITDPAENSFGTQLSGSISNAGPFDATISFPEGLTIIWSGAPLGTINMPDINVVGDVGATINNKGTFQVADVDHLANFTKTLLTAESFDWTITGNGLSVSALGITVPGVSLGSKNVTLKAFNGLVNGVKINSFDLPANDPAGGIHLTLNTTISNPSQVGISLSTIGFQNFIGNTNLGPASSESAFTMAPQSSVNLPLVGRLIPQTTPEGLATVSQVFTDFIHGQSSLVTVNGDFAGPSSVTWLNEAIKALSLTTTLPAQGVLDVITSIDLNELKLIFTDDTAFAPLASTDDTAVSFQLPFGFPLDVVEVGQTLSASFEGQAVASLDVPLSPTTTDVDARIIHLTFENVPFNVDEDAHGSFQDFLKATTASKSQTFALSGSAVTMAQTAVGLLTISGISFADLQTTIAGLQDLNAKPAVVSNLDVNHGFPDFLLITVETTLFNPSNLTIGTGDVSFNLQFQGQTIGSADLSDLIIVPGNANYSTDVHYQPSGSSQSAAGQQLLANFIQGTDSQTTISGSDGTTDIISLQPALAQISLGATIPALHQNLITATHIEFPTDIVKTGIASATFSLSNPFTASINLLQVSATAIFQNITLGTIDVDESSDPIHADGHSDITSSQLPLKFNLEPSVIIDLLTIRAEQKGIDLGPLPELFQIALLNPNLGKNITSIPDTSAATCSSGNQFDIDGAILNALSGLQTDLKIDSTVKLDDFETPLNFIQSNVPSITDDSALFLIGAVANPVTQALVNQAELSFKVANITNISNEGFDLALDGSLTNTGPLDALIEFTEPVTVNWQGNNIATISLPPVCAAANVGVPNYTPLAHLIITDLSTFTEFATFLLHNDEFTWTLSSSAVQLTALNTIFSGVTLEKSVSFKAFNGLPGVTISNFQLPSDNPQGGITISTDSKIPSPAQLGIELGTVNFESFFKGIDLGPLVGENLFLAADTTTTLHLDGRIIPQSGTNLNTVGELFSEFLAGEDSTLQVKGLSVDPNGNGEVSWLSTAFQSLTLDVVLPGEGNLSVIQSITIEDLEVVMTEQSEAFAPLSSSKDTLATYKNPFGFSLQVIEAATQITLASGEINVAQLDLPSAPAIGGVSTGNVADLQLSFQNQTLKSLNDDAFAAFFGAVTDTASVTAELKGTADVTAKTPIGNVPISGILFNVQSSLPGLNGFGHEVTLTNVSITGSGGAGGSQFIVSPLTNTLNNPSNISLSTIDISLPTFFNGVEIGRAVVNNFDLIPGSNAMAAEFHYEPADANDTIAQSFLTEFLSTGNSIPLTIKGDDQSSPFSSLVPGLEGLALDTSLAGINQQLLQHIDVFITVESLLTGFVSIDINIFNPLDTDLTILFIQSDAGVGGTIFAHVDFAFEPGLVIPAHTTVNSGNIPNVNLTQGIIASLGIIGENLDVFSAITNQVGDNAGYTIPWLQYSQTNVPTTFNVENLVLRPPSSNTPESGGIDPKSDSETSTVPTEIAGVQSSTRTLPSQSATATQGPRANGARSNSVSTENSTSAPNSPK